MNAQKNRIESNTTACAHACAAFIALLVIGYAFSATEVGSAMDSAPAVTAPQDLAPTSYFPSQYVNQGKSVEEHIQAF
jgi:hypothetical protein